MTHLYKIKDKQGQIVTFEPNIIQRKHLIERGAHRYNLILKARQHGITTLYSIDLLDEALWVPGMSCAIIGHEREATDMIFNIVKRAFMYLPEEIKPETKTDTKRMLQFTKSYDGLALDSSIYVAMHVRSGTVLNLHVTESAFIKDRAELEAGSKQAVPKTGRISEETTGNGFNEFYDKYSDASAKKPIGELDYQTYFYAWFENPDYSLSGELAEKTQEEIELFEKYHLTDGQLIWRRWKMEQLKQSLVGVGLTGAQLFKQEYPSSPLEAFQSGAGNVFDTVKIEEVQPVEPISTQEATVLFHPNDERIQKMEALIKKGLWVWEPPVDQGNYVIGVDPSDGEGADFGVIDVWERDTLHQVAQFYGKTRPDELAEITAEIATVYNKAYVGVENNMLTTILFLSKIYDRYYFESKYDERTQKRTKKIGWSTNVKTRDVMIDDFIILFDEGHLTIRSKVTLSEMRTFIKNDAGKREHALGKHDDALFGGFIAMQMRKFDRPSARTFATKPF